MDLQKAEVGLQDAGNVPKELAETVWYFAYRHDMVWPSLKEGRKAVAKNVWLCELASCAIQIQADAECSIRLSRHPILRASPGLVHHQRYQRSRSVSDSQH